MQHIFNVSDITEYIQEILENDQILRDVWIHGEVTNFVRSSNGHIYFSLRDERSQIKCVLFRRDAIRQLFLPKNGDAVVVHGAVRVYEPNGVYQLYADLIHPIGEGLLRQRFQALYTKLEREGLFDPSRKRPLPPRPRYIGVITSPVGAVWHDIQTILRRRYPLAHLLLAPALVQGEDAPATIIAALEALHRDGRAELIVLARGGGSLEDLWCFNDEQLVRALFASRIPIVSAIGHETDYTLCDFVADLRAPTPSAAAEQITPDIRDLQQAVWGYAQRASQATELLLAHQRALIRSFSARLDHASPRRTIDDGRIRLDDIVGRMNSILATQLQRARMHLTSLERELTLLHPRHPLERGYSIIVDPSTRRWLRSAGELSDPQAVHVIFADGHAEGTIRPVSKAQGGHNG